jgi:hypothetical protein
MPAEKELRDELQELAKEGQTLLDELGDAAAAKNEAKAERQKKAGGSFNLLKFGAKYQAWYSAALPLVRQLMPDRYEEFQQCYKNDKRKQLTFHTFTMSDYVKSLLPRGLDVAEVPAYMIFSVQIDIVLAAEKRFDSRLADIRGILQAELFDDEVTAASDLVKKGHLRAAGAVAGVVLERHLAKVAADHGIVVRKAHPTIADLNDPLKKADVYELPTWRRIQHLADLRNLCDHFKGREPSKDEVEELIRGADWVVKNIF